MAGRDDLRNAPPARSPDGAALRSMDVSASTGTATANGGPSGAGRLVPFPARRLAVAAAWIGTTLVGLGLASAVWGAPEIYPGILPGYDPPFLVVAGILLLVLAPRILERTSAAWLFSVFAAVVSGIGAVVSPNYYSLPAALLVIGFGALMVRSRGGFYRASPQRSGATELAVIVAGLMSLLFGTVGARWLGNEFTPNLKGWAEALYFTVTTISTNGSGIEPATDAARLFVVGLILLGVGTFLSAIVVLFLPFVERRLNRLTERLERAQMHELEQHVIVCGASAEATATARALRASGARAVVLSTDSQVVDLLRSEGFRTHLGDPSVEEDLRSVGIGRARALVVAQGSDAESLLTVITARALQPGLRIVAIASSETSIPKLRKAGANEAFSVVGVAAQLMSTAALAGVAPGAGRDPAGAAAS